MLASSPAIVARALSRDGEHVAALTADGAVEVAALRRPQVVQRWSVGDDACGLSMGEGAARVVVLRAGRGAELWSAPDGRRLPPERAYPCGERLSTATRGFAARRSVRGSERSAALAPGDDALITTEHELSEIEEYYGGGYVDSASRCRLWSLGERPRELELFRDSATRPLSYSALKEQECARVREAVFSRCGRWFALRRSDRVVEVWAREDGGARRLHALDASAQALAFVDAGLLVAIDASLHLRPLAGARAPPPLPLHAAPTRLAVSPRGRWLAIAFPDGPILTFAARADPTSGAIIDPRAPTRRLEPAPRADAPIESLTCGDAGQVAARRADHSVSYWAEPATPRR
ncbi:MAG: hypothetical protein R3A79_03255 [Nannocystaceae bacterium]